MRNFTFKEIRKSAFHEAGHAVVSVILRRKFDHIEIYSAAKLDPDPRALVSGCLMTLSAADLAAGGGLRAAQARRDNCNIADSIMSIAGDVSAAAVRDDGSIRHCGSRGIADNLVYRFNEADPELNDVDTYVNCAILGTISRLSITEISPARHKYNIDYYYLDNNIRNKVINALYDNMTKAFLEAARIIIEHYWDAVRRVAEALYEKKTLTYDEVIDIVKDSLDKQQDEQSDKD